MFPWPAQPNEPLDWDELKAVFTHALTSNPRVFQNYRVNKTGEGFEATPMEDLFGSSPLLDYVRQFLPNKLGDTKVGAFLERNKPGWAEDSEIADTVHNWVQNAPLGGYSKDHMDQLKAFREENPEVMRNTVHRSQVQRYDDPLRPADIQDRGRLRAAQMAGVALGDFIQQGVPFIWWGLNAPPALAAFGTLNSIHRAGDEFYPEGMPAVPLLKRRVGRLMVAAPAWIGMNMATGQFGRQTGFTAAAPSEADPKIATDPLSEAVSRVLLGRNGQMLPYREFVKERPDVTKGEYEAYKAYLHGNKMPIKATLDGINGPEVNFVGKSIPLLTGILPAAAMMIGARRGAKLAGKRLSNYMDPQTGETISLLEERQRRWKAYDEAGGTSAGEAHSADLKADRETGRKEVSEAELRKLYDAYTEVDRQIEGETMRQAIGYGSLGMTGTALAGATLEALRRALKGKAPIEEEDPAALPSAPPADLRAQP